MKFVHHPNYTCLAQANSFDASHNQLERYTFPFAGPADDEAAIKLAVRSGIQLALESRANRGITIGRMHVEMDEDNPGSGRIVDHVARLDIVDCPLSIPPAPLAATPAAEAPAVPPVSATTDVVEKSADY